MSIYSQNISVSPEVLTWARKTLFGKNMDLAAKKVGVSVDGLKRWESETSSISISQLKKISKAYRREITVFLLDTPPKSQQPPKFRKISNVLDSEFDQSTFFAFREAQEIQNNAVFLLENKLNESIRHLKTHKLNVNKLVQSTSSILGLDEKNRYKSRDSREQLIFWKRRLESQGIIVLELKFNLEDARGFALYNAAAPVIVINRSDSYNGRIFTLFHEFAHIILGQTDIDQDFEFGLKNSESVEHFCNRFSASFLVPDSQFEQIISENKQITEKSVGDIAKHFKVSSFVILVKLKENQHITNSKFKFMADRINKFSDHKKNGNNKQFIGNANTHLYLKIKSKSELFVSEVFNAYNTNRISYFDVLSFLDINSKHVSRLQKIMIG